MGDYGRIEPQKRFYSIYDKFTLEHIEWLKKLSSDERAIALSSAPLYRPNTTPMEYLNESDPDMETKRKEREAKERILAPFKQQRRIAKELLVIIHQRKANVSALKFHYELEAMHNSSQYPFSEKAPDWLSGLEFYGCSTEAEIKSRAKEKAIQFYLIIQEVTDLIGDYDRGEEYFNKKYNPENLQF